MKRLAVRLTLLGSFVIATGTSAYLFWTGQSRERIETGAARAFDAAALDAERSVMELKAGQPAYVAAGQGDQFWASKVTTTATRLRDALTGLQSTVTAPEAQSALDSAASALQDFEQMDRRARDYVRSGQKLLASDMIFDDSLAMTDAMRGLIEQARSAELQARDAAAAAGRRAQLIATVGAGVVALLVILLLIPRVEPRAAPSASSLNMARDAEDAVAAVELRPDLQQNLPARQSQTEASRIAAPAVGLGSVASLCTDLARVGDTRALPAILERIAAVLDAPGIVLWIADPDGRELSPIITHGYSPQLVSRLGTIVREAENVTASAFRTSLLQTVDADTVSNGAIAAPLVTVAGCVGVMAAEVRNLGEKDPTKLAAATIVAAQLATLVGPPSARAQARTGAAGA
jgi:CHASE3 domain sensor protein